MNKPPKRTSASKRPARPRPRQTVVRPPARPETGSSIEGVIFPARAAVLSRTALHRALDRSVRSWLAAVCTWDEGWSLGDHRFAAFYFKPTPATHVYVQFWSEPLEPVLWEVCSGRAHEATGDWIGSERAERIRTFGFEIGGPAENFRRQVDIDSPADLTSVARTVVDILYAAFDYRGAQPLHVEFGSGTRAEVQPVYESLTPEDLMKLMARRGFIVMDASGDDDEPVLQFRKRGIPTTVELGERVEGGRLFAALSLTCEMEPRPEDVERLTRLAERLPPGDGQPRVRLGTSLSLSGGVTAAWLDERIAEWDQMTRTFKRGVRRGAKIRRAAVSETVH